MKARRYSVDRVPGRTLGSTGTPYVRWTLTRVNTRREWITLHQGTSRAVLEAPCLNLSIPQWRRYRDRAIITSKNCRCNSKIIWRQCRSRVSHLHDLTIIPPSKSDFSFHCCHRILFNITFDIRIAVSCCFPRKGSKNVISSAKMKSGRYENRARSRARYLRNVNCVLPAWSP